MIARGCLLALLLLIGACGDGFTEVDHPFYLYLREDGEVDLVRCPTERGVGCAVDGLPEQVLAAGANEGFVVAQTTSGYFYFAREPEETRGWGKNPERLIGPLGAESLPRPKRSLSSPSLMFAADFALADQPGAKAKSGKFWPFARTAKASARRRMCPWLPSESRPIRRRSRTLDIERLLRTQSRPLTSIGSLKPCDD
jgi:hypothetical protein